MPKPKPEPVDVAELFDVLRRVGGELESGDVKSGAGGFPTPLRETLAALDRDTIASALAMSMGNTEDAT